jgi:homoserine O-acetyltransferase
MLHRAQLRYALYGQMNTARDNVVLVCHALSGAAQVADWWPALFSPLSIFDSERSCVLGINVIGSCYGSTGPGSVNPATGRPYGKTLPLIQIADMVKAQALLVDWLGIPRLQLAIGASLGGMQVLEWALQFPDRLEEAIVIGAAPLNAMGLGLNHLQRQAIQLDPAWQDGDYTTDAPPRRGLALARALAICSYKSGTLFDQRFERNPDRSGEDPWLDRQPAGRFDVAGYLDHQGEKFVQRFDANSYLALTRAMDLWDPARSNREVWGRIRAKITLIGISSDWLFPSADIRALHESISLSGVDSTYRELLSSHGHDAFLAEPQSLLEVLRP